MGKLYSLLNKSYQQQENARKKKIAQQIGLSPTTIWRNIEAMRGKYLRRVGPDKGGFWEIFD